VSNISPMHTDVRGPVRRTDGASDGCSDLSTLAVAVHGRLDELTDRLVEELRSHDVAYAGATVPRDDLWQSCHANLDQVVRHLVAEPADVKRAFDPPRQTGRRRAEQGFPLEHLLHAYRVGGRMIWDCLLAEARASPPPATERLAEDAGRVWDVIDAYSGVVAGAYRDRETDLRRHDDERRLLLLDGLLEGRGHDARFAREAAAVLDLPHHGLFVVVVVSHPTPAASPPPPAIDLPAVWRLRGTQHVAIVSQDGTGPGRLRSLLSGYADAPVGISPPVTIAELARAYRWAELAAAGAREGTVAVLDEELPAALLAVEPDLTERLVHRVHDALASIDGGERDRLLTTLDAYLANSMSVTTTAEGMYCHRNTVKNRLARFESLTGRSLSDVSDLVEIALARAAVHRT
jgi:hypothetical protein